LGYPGMLIESAFLVLLLWLADDVTRDLDFRTAAIIFIMPAISFTNGSAFTSVLTYGFGAALICCAIMPRPAPSVQSSESNTDVHKFRRNSFASTRQAGR